MRKAVLAFIGLSTVAWAILNDPDTFGPDFRQSVEISGFALVAIAVFGRTWCAWFIAGKKKRVLVQNGPYSISRNPLYVFSVIGAFGVGLASGSIVSALAIGGVCFLVFYCVIRHEERYLYARFKDQYVDYCKQVRRWIGLRYFKDYCDAPDQQPNSRLMMITLRDSSAMFLAIPFFEATERLQDVGIFRAIFGVV